MNEKHKDYFNDAKKTKEQLETISPTMCMAKWLQVSIHLPQGLTQSCYHPPTHKIPLHELEITPKALHNTVEKVLQRKDMWEGKRPEGCQYCWNIEDAPDGPHLSDRHYRSSEWWVGDDGWNEVVEGGWDENLNPRYVEVNFNQACNFKCTYCSPHLSTEWEKEIKEYGPIKMSGGTHNNIESLRKTGLMPIETSQKENPYVKAFWEWWPDLYKDLKVFRMTGGEPLMDKNTFKIFNYIVDNPNPDLELSITSNLCPPQDKLFDNFLKSMKKMENTIDDETYDDWSTRGLLREITYYAKSDGTADWKKWPRFLVLFDSEQYEEIDADTPRIKYEEIDSNFNDAGLDEKTGDFLYTLVWYKPSEKKEWNCIGSRDQGKEGNNGIFLDIPRMKNFMLFASVDSFGDQAEYIRTGLNWETFETNVKRFLSETNNTEITFINTFNLLSIPKLKDFLKFILELRTEYGYKKQVLVSSPDSRKKSDKNVVRKLRQRIWFDIPYLREPIWMSAQNASRYPELIKMLEECLKFMEENVEDENYSRTYQGFKKYEIAKLKRDIAWIKNGTKDVSDIQLEKRKKMFYEYFNQIDDRRNTNFIETFPEMKTWWNDCYEESQK